jgi:hypothetical protein
MGKDAKDATVKDLTVEPGHEVKGGAPRATTKKTAAQFEKFLGDGDITFDEYATIHRL